MTHFLESLWTWGGLPTGFAFMLMLDSMKKENEQARQLWAGLFVGGLIGGLTWGASQWLGHDPSTFYVLTYLLGLAAGGFFGFFLLRELPALSDKISQKFTRKTDAERNKRTDVREIAKHLPPPMKHYDPRKFFDQKKGLFLGLDEHKEPIYLDPTKYKIAPHAMVAGSSGGGKGVLLGVMAAQWVAQGEAVVFVDPKDDEWAPHVMADAARRVNKPHKYINMRAKLPQFNLFDGADADEVEELLIAGFGLIDTGSAADFYSIADRKYAGIVARQIVAENLTAAQAYIKNAAVLDEHAPKLGGKLRELGQVTAANARPGAGFAFPDFIQEGGSLYVVGSLRDPKIVRLQRMFLVRIIQIAEKRDRIAGPLRPVAVVLDEIKYHLSRTALEALGAARDKGVHVTMAFQSLGDLKDCPGDLTPDAVVGAVVDNAKIKLCYKAENPETAEWLASFTGDILVDDESRQVVKNVAMAEKVHGDRTIRQAERYYIDRNMMQNLHPMTPDYASLGVVFGLGLARFANISMLRVEKDAANIHIDGCDDGGQIEPPEELI